MNELTQEDDKDLHKKAKLTKKTSSNRFRKPLRVLVVTLILIFLCLSIAFLIYLSKTFYFFSKWRITDFPITPVPTKPTVLIFIFFIL